MGTPFKMKGSPMYRNFGIGSPVKNEEKSEEQRKITFHKKMNAWNKANPNATQAEMNAYQSSLMEKKTAPTKKATYTGKVRAKATGTTDTAMADS